MKRNNYFLGKLLTAEDCKLEQDYFNNKRWLINQCYLGKGVVYGLIVKASKGLNGLITINPGLAIDDEGHEIIISSPQNCNLRDITNFQAGVDSQRIAYLCIEYKEKVDSPATSAFTIYRKEFYEHTEEYYNIYLDYGSEFLNDDQLEEVLKKENYFWNRSVIYTDTDLVISIKVPKYIQRDMFLKQGLLKYEIEIEKLVESNDKISISFDNKISDENDVEIVKLFEFSFNEAENSDSMVYNIPKLCVIPDNVMNKKQNLSLKIDISKVKLNENEVESVNIKQDVELVYDIKSKLREQYFLNNEKNTGYNSSKNKLYLAKIFYTSMGVDYIIDNIINLPFNQYIEKGCLADIIQNANINEAQVIEFLNKTIEDKIDCVKKELNDKSDKTNEKLDNTIKKFDETSDKLDKAINRLDNINKELEATKILFSCVQEQLSQCSNFNYDIYEITADPDKTVESKPISHGLGKGDVQINCEVIKPDKSTFDISTKLDKTKGEFTISLNCNGSLTAPEQIKLAWYVYKNLFKENLNDDFLIIKPSFAFIECNSSFEFTILSNKDLTGMTNTVSPDKGTTKTVSNKLNYTAPSESGFYEVKVSLEKMTATAFVYVTDKNQ